MKKWLPPKLHDGRRWYVTPKGDVLINVRSFRRKPFTKAEWNAIQKAIEFMRASHARLH